MGRQFVLSALHQFRFHTDDNITRPVRRIGREIVLAAGGRPDDFHFFVVANPQANAFAIPGGYIFVFDGLLERLHDEEELAGVLAHEVAHVKLAHFFKDQKKIAAADVAAIAAILLGGVNPAITTVSLAGSASMQLAYSREHEREADQEALDYLERAAYDPHGLVGFFETLHRQERLVLPVGQYPYLSTHPGLSERLTRAERMIERRGVAIPKRRNTDDWSVLTGAIAAGSSAGRAVAGDLAQGVALYTGNRFAEALPVLERAASTHPDSVAAQTFFGLALLRNKRLEEAGQAARRALAAGVDYAPAHYLAGEVARVAGDTERAKRAYQNAIKVDAGHVMSHFRLSGLLAADGEVGWADFHLARYARLTLKPSDAMAIFKRIEAGDDDALARRVQRQIAGLLREGV